jgi:hypothetical protein
LIDISNNLVILSQVLVDGLLKVKLELFFELQRVQGDQLHVLALEEQGIESIDLRLVLQRVQTLHEDIQIVFYNKTCKQVLQQLDIYIIHAFKLQVVKPDDGVLDDLPEGLQVSRHLLDFSLD